MKLNRKLKMGMVGGGPGAFIGEVHRKAARMDGGIELVAGAFDINPRKSKQMGRELCIEPRRAYRTYSEMIERELKLPGGERVDFVSITTPNNWHFPIARDFLEAGFHVMCEKPMTFNVAEARALNKMVRQSRLVFGLMHNYTGYPMVKLARDMAAVSAGVAGDAAGEDGAAAGGVADGPETERGLGVHGRYRDARGEPGRIYHGAEDTRDLRRPDDICQRAEAGRRRQLPATVQ
jgi:predicted dehydrogenase